MWSALSKHRQDSAALVFLIALLIITILTMWLLKRRKFRFMHETGGAMLYGMGLGVIMKCLASLDWTEEPPVTVYGCFGLNSTPPHTLTVNITTHLHRYQHVREVSSLQSKGSPMNSGLHQMTFDPEVLFNLFLPPIIFHGAYTLNQRRFIDNLGSVLTFAFLGTVITCGVIGASMYGVARLMVWVGQAAEGDFLLTDCLLFGAIMSATDPVAVLALFSELRVDPDLYALLFGESVLNDAVAIVLTHAITSYSLTGAPTFDVVAFFLSVGHFVAVFMGSFLVGFSYTVITALLTKYTQLRECPLLETSLLFLLSWSAFLCAEALGLSGIVAVLFCGITQARYTIHNLSSEAKTRIEQLFEFFSFLGEIFIFCYIGYVLFTFPHHVFKALFICGAFLSVFASRACNVYPLAFLLNLGRRNRIPCNVQHIMMLSGVRGAVAFALAVRDTSTEARRAVLSTVLVLICATVFVLGATTSPMLRWLDIRVGVDADESPEEEPPSEQGTTDGPGTQGSRPDRTLGLWYRLEYKYLKPALTHSGPPLAISLPLWCGPLARVLTSPPAYQNQEQLGEAETDDCTSVKLENVRTSVGGDSESVAPPDDLLEGDLGLGTRPTPAWEEGR